MPVANSIMDTIKRHFISGVLVVVPIILTYIVLKFLFEAVDGILQPLILQVFGYHFPGLGVITTLLIIILAGVLTRNYIGARLYRYGDRLLVKMPLIRPIYSAAKQLLESMATSTTQTFKQVGLVEYPRRGSYALCFISNSLTVTFENQEPQPHYAVFVPSTPTPVSGIALILPVEEVILVDMSVEEGVKFLVSGGVASPSKLKERIKQPHRAKMEEVLS
jgi:uncharacterized membrane protein